MDDRPEPLRLFDPSRSNGGPSQYETPSRQSQFETPPPLSRIGTCAEELPDSSGLLRAVADAADEVAAARLQLDVAIEAARVAGCSWRQIGTAAGVAYQSLHRRHRKRGAT